METKDPFKIQFNPKGIHQIDQDLRTLSRDELAPFFASKSSGRIMLAPLIKAVICQAFLKIKAGTELPIEGNIRTFWYRWLKPVLAHIHDDEPTATDPYDLMLRAFSQLIMEQKLFQYADFDFTDENWENRRIGNLFPQILVFSEKSGWVRFLRTIHDKFGVSTLALGGAPSALTSEYTTSHIKKALLSENAAVSLIGVVDYDPSGDMIAEAFKGQLEACGLKVASLTTVIEPKHYSAEELNIYKYPLPTGQKTKNENWLKKTGGIDGKPFGLEAESLHRERLNKLVEVLIIQAIEQAKPS